MLGLSIVLGACNQTTEIVTASVPNDYRQRHPIAVTEANRSIVVFVGHATRRPVRAAARRRHGTGADLGSRRNRRDRRRRAGRHAERARAAAAFREIQSALMAGGVPSRAITLRHYRPDDPRTLADDQAELSEDCGGRRPLRPVAGGPRAHRS